MKKLSVCTIAVAACFFANTSYASTPLISWSLKDAPSSGVNELHFPMTFSLTPDASGLYFAYYTTLTGGSRPYTGFQPKPPRVSGKHTYQSVFSSFNSAAKTEDGNCVYGADGGDGVSCSTQFEAESGRFYSNRLTVSLKDNDIYYYSGDVYDDSTNQKIAHIGSFTIPLSAGAGLFKAKDGGFIEAYIPAGCTQKVSATYGEVTGYLDGNKYSGNPVKGSVPETGNCVNAVFSASSIPDSTDVKVTDPQPTPKPTYSTIINKYKGDSGNDNRCLRVFNNNNSAEMGGCNGQGSDYTSMRQWQFSKTNNGYYLIKNKYKGDSGNDNRCLRVFASGNTAEMGACAGQGGASDYDSMRYWSVVDSGTGYILLKNKYKGDSGNDNRCLRVFASGNTAEMGACAGQGGASDYDSMRYWKYDGALK
ncbi:RICIN domain-containing protein [Salmonella enterica]|nr:RICIN domain-containing protein [Salmonella enterica]EIL1177658.1 RICIN domain-containing protein [Salmonella enterica]